jgi:hypothetical protein
MPRLVFPLAVTRSISRTCGWRALLLAALAVLLALLLFQFPSPGKPGLDPSWEMVLVYAHRHALQFGRDIAFTYGPYGFLTSRFYYDAVPLVKILWESAGKLALAATLVAMAASTFSSWFRFGLFYLGLIFAAKIAPDIVIFLSTPLLALCWLLPPKSKSWQVAAALTWMAFLAQIRFNYFIQALVALGLVIPSLLLERKSKKLLVIVSSFAAGFVFLWLVAGQAINDLPAYFRSSWEISNGYLAAMAVNQLPIATWCSAAGICFLVVAFILSLLRSQNLRAEKWMLLYFCCTWYFIWKYGVTRADTGHIVLFFPTAFVFCAAAPGLFQHRHWWSFLDASLILSLAGLWLFNSSFLRHTPQELAQRLHAAPGELFRPKRQAQRFAAAEAATEKAHPPKNLGAIVEEETIDVINFEQYFVLREHLNYWPRPVFQSYCAYTPALLKQNLLFYQSSSAPQFVFARLQSVDGRFPAQDDSLLLEELPRRYSIAKEANDFLLLHRKPVQPTGELLREKFPMRHVSFGQEIEVPETVNCAVELRAIFKPSIYGAARAFLVQPAQVNLVLTDGKHGQHTGRLIPEMAAAGFLVQPLLQSDRDFADFMAARPGRSVRSIHFEPVSATGNCWSQISIQFSKLPELTFGPATAD